MNNEIKQDQGQNGKWMPWFWNGSPVCTWLHVNSDQSCLTGLSWRTQWSYCICTCVRKVHALILPGERKDILKTVSRITHYSCVFYNFWSNFPDSNGFWHQEHNPRFLALCSFTGEMREEKGVLFPLELWKISLITLLA